MKTTTVYQSRLDQLSQEFSEAPPAKLRAPFRHYGSLLSYIRKARKNGYSNLTIAQRIFDIMGVGPVERVNGRISLNREAAKTYISYVLNHSKVEE